MLSDMSERKNTAIIVAAGNGSRLGSETPKQFLLLAGREILSYSVNTFLDHPQVDEVIIVIAEAYRDYVSRQYPSCQIVLGGPNRQDSVLNGLNACSANTEIVLVHDAARPLIPPHIIDDCLKQLETHDGVAPAIKPIDTIIQLKDEQFLQLDRENLRRVQTPQCFHLKTLQQAYKSIQADTDEMGLVNRTIPAARLAYLAGAEETIKITSPQDLEIAEIYLQSLHS